MFPLILLIACVEYKWPCKFTPLGVSVKAHGFFFVSTRSLITKSFSAGSSEVRVLNFIVPSLRLIIELFSKLRPIEEILDD
jgi:hypothetical protein